MKKKSIVTGTIATLAVVAIVIFMICYAAKPTPIYIQGEVDVTSVKISSKLTGRVDSLLVKQGQSVKKGDLLFVLDTPDIDAKLKQAEAARDAASAQREKADKGARVQEIDAAYSVWQNSLAGLDLAKKTYDRIKNLYESGVVPSQKLDEAEASLKSMEATVDAARSQYNMAFEGARTEDKMAAYALVAQATGAIMEVESYMADSRMYAPFDGEVSSLIAEQGELIGSGYPIITLLDFNDMWVSFNIKEDLLPKIKMGTVLNAYVKALDKNVKMTVDYMSPQADYAQWSATKTRGDFDIRTFEVRATPEPTEGLRPGMTVVVNWTEL